MVSPNLARSCRLFGSLLGVGRSKFVFSDEPIGLPSLLKMLHQCPASRAALARNLEEGRGCRNDHIAGRDARIAAVAADVRDIAAIWRHTASLLVVLFDLPATFVDEHSYASLADRFLV